VIFLGSKDTKGKDEQDLGTTLKSSDILGNEATKPIVPLLEEATSSTQGE